jgi:hypothetical protein
MLEGGSAADISDHAAGVTFEYKAYKKKIKGSTFQVFDTIGLNEGAQGKVAAGRAIDSLYRLISDLDDGLTLLVFVMRAPRIKAITQKNYEMFFEIFCDKAVPIVIIVTGLENRDDMDSWWTENEDVFKRYKMKFNGFACITATKGRQRKDGTYVYEEEYTDSKRKVEDLISKHSGEVLWKRPTKDRLDDFITKLYNFLIAPLTSEPMDPKKVRLAKQSMK